MIVKPFKSKTPTSLATKLLRAKIAELKGARERKEKTVDPMAYRPGMGSEFYQTREWKELRYEVLKESDGKCAQCGSEKKPLQVDHKLPRSKFPHLELVKSNMQILCEICNIGKGASI